MMDKICQKVSKNCSSEFKGRVALEAAVGAETIARLSSKHEIHPTQVGQWKRRLEAGVRELFEDRAPADALKEKDALIEELYSHVGRLTVDRHWLKNIYDH